MSENICCVRLKNPAKTCVREPLAYPIQGFLFNITQQIFAAEDWKIQQKHVCESLWPTPYRVFFSILRSKVLCCVILIKKLAWDITQLYCHASLLCKLWSGSLKMLKFNHQRPLSLKIPFDWCKATPPSITWDNPFKSILFSCTWKKTLYGVGQKKTLHEVGQRSSHT